MAHVACVCLRVCWNELMNNQIYIIYDRIIHWSCNAFVGLRCRFFLLINIRFFLFWIGSLLWSFPSYCHNLTPGHRSRSDSVKSGVYQIICPSGSSHWTSILYMGFILYVVLDVGDSFRFSFVLPERHNRTLRIDYLCAHNDWRWRSKMHDGLAKSPNVSRFFLKTDSRHEKKLNMYSGSDRIIGEPV